MTIRTPLFLLFISLFALIVSGCLNLGGGTQKATRFFILHSATQLKQQDINTPKNNKRSIGIGPISIPKLLDRRQIVTRVNDTEVQVSKFSRWAEPLSDNITGVLSENLSLLLETDQVVVYPWFGNSPEYQVKIDVIQFDSPLKGDAVLSTKWQIIKVREKRVVFQKRSSFKEPVEISEIEAMIPVLGKLLERFSNQIAMNIVSLD